MAGVQLALMQIFLSREKNMSKKNRISEMEAQLSKQKKYERFSINMWSLAAVAFFIQLVVVAAMLVTKGDINVLAMLFAFVLEGLILFTGLYTTYKTSVKIKNLQEDISEALINQLNDIDFKEVKLKKSKNVILRTLLKNNIIEAKLDNNNDTIVVIRLSFFDDSSKANAVTKNYIFRREDIKNILQEVVEENVEQ